jgi:hypothetical protein
MLLFVSLFLVLSESTTQAQDQVTMYMVNPLTGDNTFNVTNYPIGSVFAVEFYVNNVTDMIAWQIRLLYNRTIINYDKAWFPDDNVFKQAIDNGAIPTKGIAVNVNNATDTSNLLIVMTCTSPQNSSLRYPVSVQSRGLLCIVNFTIVKHTDSTELMFMSQSNSTRLDVLPPYYLKNLVSSIETLDGTYLADGEPAFIYVPEVSIILLLIWIPAVLALIIIRRKSIDRTSGSLARSRRYSTQASER